VTRACTVRTCMDAHTCHVPATQRCCSAGNPKGASNMRYHQGSQALIQHQAGLVLFRGCKASQEPLSCKLASISALTFALHKLTCMRPFAAMVLLNIFAFLTGKVHFPRDRDVAGSHTGSQVHIPRSN